MHVLIQPCWVIFCLAPDIKTVTDQPLVCFSVFCFIESSFCIYLQDTWKYLTGLFRNPTMLHFTKPKCAASIDLQCTLVVFQPMMGPRGYVQDPFPPQNWPYNPGQPQPNHYPYQHLPPGKGVCIAVNLLKTSLAPFTPTPFFIASQPSCNTVYLKTVIIFF